jgi:polysaccharide biosynthesis protein PslG
MSSGVNVKRRIAHRIPKTALLVVMAAGLATTNAMSASGAGKVAAPKSTKVTPAAHVAVPQPPFTPDFFGMAVGADLTTLKEAQFDNEMNLMKKIGVRWVRALIPWSMVEHNNADEENWVLVDRLVNMVEAENMKLLGIIEIPPQWAQRNITPTNCAEQPPFDLPAYAAFAAKVAARYGSARMAALELENAPNLPGIWDGANPCAYTRLMQAAYPAIKAVDPNIIVLTAGLGSQSNNDTAQAGDIYLKNLYANGAAGSFDVLSWHPYSYPCFPSASCPIERPWYRIDKVRQEMVAHGDGAKQIWATEFGAPTGGVDGDGHQDENNQAAMMVDAMKHWAALPYAGPFFAFIFRDAGANPTKKSDWFGLESHNGKHKKLSYYTFQWEATSKSNVPIPPNVLDGVPHS